MTIWLVAYLEEKQGWCVIDPKGNPHAGPYSTHEEAVQAVQTMAFRKAQGWEP